MIEPLQYRDAILAPFVAKDDAPLDLPPLSTAVEQYRQAAKYDLDEFFDLGLKLQKSYSNASESSFESKAKAVKPSRHLEVAALGKRLRSPIGLSLGDDPKVGKGQIDSDSFAKIRPIQPKRRIIEANRHSNLVGWDSDSRRSPVRHKDELKSRIIGMHERIMNMASQDI